MPAVYSYFTHSGEEPPISGTKGSGTIFFTHCTMRCVYCQNYSFSQLSDEKEVSTGDLAWIMLGLQNRGCHNINLVTPTHYVPQILEALLIAAKEGLDIPIVYNTSGYETVDTLRMLDGIIDIYLPDMRYGDDASAGKFSDAPDYVKFNRMAIAEMFRQVGGLEMGAECIARKGIIIRHLVLPGGVSGTKAVFKFIAEEVSRDTYISLMSQYFPAHKACSIKELNRRITQQEYEEAVSLLSEYGLSNGWVQDPSDRMDNALLGTNIKKIWGPHERPENT